MPGSEDASSFDLIVIGGGPAGSTAAALAAKQGLRVLLLEADRHPRAHVGESLLPGIIPILDEMGALAEIENAGFGLKSGTTHWQWGRTPAWDLWFADTDLYDHAWLVDRARFDEILFRCAERNGAVALEHAAVKQLIREGDRVVGVRFRRKSAELMEEQRARFVIDASGQAALFARDAEIRTPIEGLLHQATWAHYENAGRLPAPREHQALFVAEPGYWLWLFPFANGRASVGIVRLDSDDARDATLDRAARFERDVAASKLFSGVLGSAARRIGAVRTERDWSYRMSRVAGPGYLLAGDASGFIDPVLSTGVFLAMHAARQAALGVSRVCSGALGEQAMAADYQRHHSELFDDLLRMVRFYYQQNLTSDDYFWESKRILLREDNQLRPQKAFLILTSGLVKNLAFDDKLEATLARREQALLADDPTSNLAGEDAHDPSELGFVCLHLLWQHDVRTGNRPAHLYFLIEPRDVAAPTLFRTTNWDLNCLAPRFANDPFSVPELAVHLSWLHAQIRALDTQPGEKLADFWRRSRSTVGALLRALPERGLEAVRVFGE